MERRKGLDYCEGDIVQIKPNAKRFRGQIGKIIGIKYFIGDQDYGGLLYTVQFTDRQSADYTVNQLSLVRSSKFDENKKDIDFDKRVNK